MGARLVMLRPPLESNKGNNNILVLGFWVLRDALATADLAVALAAIHGPLAAGQERDLGHLAALRALSGVHLAGCPTAEAGGGAVVNIAALLRRLAARFARRATGGAARRLVQQASAGGEGPLADGKRECRAPVAAPKGLIAL